VSGFRVSCRGRPYADTRMNWARVTRDPACGLSLATTSKASALLKERMSYRGGFAENYFVGLTCNNRQKSNSVTLSIPQCWIGEEQEGYSSSILIHVEPYAMVVVAKAEWLTAQRILNTTRGRAFNKCPCYHARTRISSFCTTSIHPMSATWQTLLVCLRHK